MGDFLAVLVSQFSRVVHSLRPTCAILSMCAHAQSCKKRTFMSAATSQKPTIHYKIEHHVEIGHLFTEKWQGNL